MNIAETLLCVGRPEAPAILCRDTAVTYEQLREMSRGIAAGLLSRGHRQGDRIGILAENGPFFIATYLGIIRAGMTAVPLPAELSPESLAGIVSSTSMKVLFVSNRHMHRLRPWTGSLGLSVWGEDDALGAAIGDHADLPKIDAKKDLAVLMFTSGSTGSPKGVMVTHRNIECNTRDIISYMGLSCNDRVMAVLPFHYCFGLSLLHTHLMVGGSLVLNNQFKLYPEAMLGELRNKECTGFAGVPSTYQILLRRSRFPDLAFPSLRWFQQAGGKLPNPFIQEILDLFPQVEFFLMYGQTEGTARLSYLPPDRLADKLGSIGRGLPSTRLEVLKADGTPVVPGSDEIGEIVASGDNITRGYWNDPVETGKYFFNGSLRTGDLARVDADGFIYVVDRERDLIKSGGNRISAKEIEDVIAELQGVLEVAVVGAPHDLLGEEIKAFVVPAAEGRITVEEIETHCRRRLPSFKVPEEVVFLETMPHNGSGKILKRELKGSAESRQLGESRKVRPSQQMGCPA